VWLLSGMILLITGFLNERWVTGSPLFEE